MELNMLLNSYMMTCNEREIINKNVMHELTLKFTPKERQDYNASRIEYRKWLKKVEMNRIDITVSKQDINRIEGNSKEMID